MEENESLICNPNLIHEKGDMEGFLAIIQPFKEDKESFPTKFLSKDQYQRLRFQ